jgi:hypothetical protein
MQPMSRPDVNPGATETQQMRITAPTGVSIEPLYPVQRRFSFQLTDFFLFGGAPHTGQHPATHTNIVFDGWAAHPRSSRLFRISSRSHGLKCRFGFVLFLNPVFPPSPFHYVVQEVPHCYPCRPLGNRTFYEDILVVGTCNQKQHPDPSLQINAARNQQILPLVRNE